MNKRFACLCAMVCAGGALAGDAVPVFVSIPPQAWVVKRVGGDAVTVSTMVPKGQEMHTFEVSPQSVQRLGAVRVYFLGGFPFESVLTGKVAAVSGVRFADMTAGVVRRDMDDGHDDAGHEHGAGGQDPHVWLNTVNLSVMVSNTAATLVALDPARSAQYLANRDAAVSELTTLREALARRTAPFKGFQLYVYHPAFGYFTDEFGLRQTAVELGGKEPTPRHLSRLMEQARRDGVQAIIVQPQFSQRSAQVVARALGGAVLPVDPMSEDVPATLGRLADAVAESRKKANP